VSTPTRQLVPSWHSDGVPESILLPARLEGANSSSTFISSAGFWYVLSRRRWTIIGVTALLTATAAIASFLMRPVFKATARLEIEPETPMLQSLNDIYQRTDADDVFLQTQIQILQSQQLAWQTIEELDLAKSLDVFAAGELSKEEIGRHKIQLIAEFENRLKLEIIPKTRMLSVSYEGPDPQLAARVATAFANNYLDYNFRQKDEAIRRSGWMEHQLSELKSDVEKSQQALVYYEQKNHIVNTSENQDVLGQMLGDLSRDLTNAQGASMEKKSLYLRLAENPGQMAGLAHDDLLQKLEERAAELKEEHTELAAQYGPNYPKATRVQKQIDENQAEIQKEQGRVLDRVRNDYAVALSRERLASAAVAHQKDEVGKQNQLMVEHNLLKHEFETNQHIYQSLLGRLKDATITAGLRSTNIHLVDSALVPSLPVRPRKSLNIAVAFVGGLFLGVMGAFARDRMDYSIKTVGEVEALAVTPVLGVIPFAPKLRGRKHQPAKLGKEQELAVALTRSPSSSLSEAFRALGTAVLTPLNPLKILLVTSPEAGEGKTITAMNLAQALAQRKGPVLLVDCDMRKGRVASALGIRNDIGLSTVLYGEDDISDALQQSMPEPNLWVLPSGPTPLDPVRLLSTEKLVLLLKTLGTKFQHIVMDSPPVLPVTDATILSTLANGVLLVVASGSTSRQGLVRTRQILATAGARVVGIAVTNLDSHSPGFKYYGYP
jgi:succinoglycan biosynthesis transport protein ExoP